MFKSLIGGEPVIFAGKNVSSEMRFTDKFCVPTSSRCIINNNNNNSSMYNIKNIISRNNLISKLGTMQFSSHTKLITF